VEKIGTGQKTFDYSPVRGIWTRLEGPEDVLDLMDKGLDNVIAVIRDAGATFLSPIFDELRGVICTEGTIRSHIGIVSREFQIPGIIAAELFYDSENGTEIILDGTGPEGLIYLAD
jgi:signal transduction protein with GAF and PtsI domain|tara:strand:+ start:905 stop:1252 length:348 start_codon:yes stop_codon:yes gene_type:complete